MNERSRRLLLAMLSLPLLIELVAIAMIGSLDVPRVVSRPIVVVAVVLAAIELLRFVEALIRRQTQPEPQDAETDEERLDVWEVVGNGFTSLGSAGMCIYVLTCAACIVGFAISIGVQTTEDAARNMLYSQSEATLLASLSMAALMLEVRIAFIRHFGWPLD